MKVTPTNMKEAHNELLSIFEKKNSDYGNSFEESLEKHGIIAAVVRMEDKMGRLNSLTKKDADQKVSDESLIDTLKDLSNYALMTAVWLEGKEPEEAQPAFADWGNLSHDGANLKAFITDLMKEKPGMTYFAALVLDNPRHPKAVSFPVKSIDAFREWFKSYIEKYPYYNSVYLNEIDGRTQVQVFSHPE